MTLTYSIDSVKEYSLSNAIDSAGGTVIASMHWIVCIG